LPASRGGHPAVCAELAPRSPSAGSRRGKRGDTYTQGAAAAASVVKDMNALVESDHASADAADADAVKAAVERPSRLSDD